MWWEDGHTPPPWIGERAGTTYQIHGAAGCTGRRYHLGRNKEVHDAELYALYRALQAFDDREEGGRRYTVFSGWAAAIDRIRTGRLGPGQQLAIEAIETCTRLLAAVRWTPCI